jgi:hypothetical protein
MKRWFRYLAVSLVCIAVMAGCPKPDPADHVLRAYLKSYLTDEYNWQRDKLYPAICRLEQAANIPVTDRLCPGGPGTGGGAPPKPPPFPE